MYTPAKTNSYKNLIVYQKAKLLTKEVIAEFDEFDKKVIVGFSKENVEILKMLTTMMKKLE